MQNGECCRFWTVLLTFSIETPCNKVQSNNTATKYSLTSDSPLRHVVCKPNIISFTIDRAVLLDCI